MSRSTSWKYASCLAMMALLMGYVLWQSQYLPSSSFRERSSVSKHYSTHSALNTATNYTSLAPGDLPGYTGWGRPTFTLAGYFAIEQEDPIIMTALEPWRATLVCRDHPLCAMGNAQFFVRAYGPAILTGTVTPLDRTSRTTSDSDSEFRYKVLLEPIQDPGTYTVEVVLTFSHPPNVTDFPIPEKDLAKYHLQYEGHLLPGFPRILNILDEKKTNEAKSISPISNKNEKKSAAALCNLDQLTIQRPIDGLTQGRWKVTQLARLQKLNQTVSPTSKTLNQVSLRRFQQGTNSLGINAEYKFNNCRLLPAPTEQLNPFAICPSTKPIHILLIGDSVMRLQHTFFHAWVARAPHIQVDFIELYGGYFLTQLQTGPKIRHTLAQTPTGAQRRFVLFNTGLHDIHRLCGTQYEAERHTYLRDDLRLQPCAAQYQLAIQDFVRAIRESAETTIPTTAVFQTSTAAWPKYGNWGVNFWDPRYGQPLPLDGTMIEWFNSLAWRALRSQQEQQQSSPNFQLHVVDAYWMSRSRPDDREINKDQSIGKKLSHPGLQVLEAMSRVWMMVLLQTMCGGKG